jgi:hypothetical protein
LAAGTQRLFDAQGLIPLCHAFAAREGANLELTDTPSDGEMHDAGVFGLTRTR